MVLPPLTVTVPVGTKDPTARRVVCTTNNMLTCMQQLIHEVYVCMYTVYFLFAACSPACQNGGTCRGSSSPYCVCPSGYKGSYCQKRGMHTTWNTHARVCVCVCVCVCTCVCVCVCPVLAEAERVVQKCDRSAANRSSMRKVENLVFAWLQVNSYL